MKFSASISIFALLLAASSCMPPAASAQSPSAQITIHADQTGAAVSPDMYGIFFEEINHAGDGGLYAEMVRNRTMKETGSDGAPTGWSLLTTGEAR